MYHQSVHQYNLNDANTNTHANTNTNIATNQLTMQLLPATMRPLTLPNPLRQQYHAQAKQTENGYDQDGNALDPDRAEGLTKQTVYGVSGIGYPQRFFATLRGLGYEVIEQPMPDHHQFRAEDLTMLTQYPIVITTKDAVKIALLVANHAQLAKLNIWVLPVRALLSAACYQTLQRQLQACAIL